MQNVNPQMPQNLCQQLRQHLAAVRSGSLPLSEFARTAREAHGLMKALPPRYEEVWLGLIDRLESSALFSEESCSFSQTDLFDSLVLWLDKAHQQLNAPT